MMRWFQAIVLAHAQPEVFGRLLKCVQGIVFLAVPHRQADISFYANRAPGILEITQPHLAPDRRLVQKLRRNSEALAAVSEPFSQVAQGMKIRSCFETELLRRNTHMVGHLPFQEH